MRWLTCSAVIILTLAGCRGCGGEDPNGGTGAGSSGMVVDSSSAAVTSGTSGASAASTMSTSSTSTVASSGVDSSSGMLPSSGDSSGTGSSSAAVVLMAVEVAPAQPTLAMGTELQLFATAVYSDGTSLDVTTQATWSSSLMTAATVTPGGLVTALAAGSTQVSALFDGATGSTTVTVSSAELSSIELTPISPTVASGTSVPLVATGIFSDATTQDLTVQAAWSSSDMAVATVDAAGVVLGVSAGTVTITATFGTVMGTTMVTVSDATLTALSVTPALPTAAAGTRVQLTATGTFSDGTTQDLSSQATWMSSSVTTATVNAAGLATALVAGTTTISAAIGLVMDSTTLTVTDAALTVVTITPGAPVLAAGGSVQLTATATFSDNSTADVSTQVLWASSDAAVATISNAPGSEGLVTAVAAGEAALTATLNGMTGSTPVTATAGILTAVTVAPVLPQLLLGGTLQFTATGTYSDGSSLDITQQVTWTSSDGAVASISNAAGTLGLAQGVAAGAATVTATLDGVSDSTVVTVYVATLLSIVVTPQTTTTAVGLAQQFTATGNYSDGSTVDLTNVVTWTSSEPAVASISNAGGTRGEATGRTLGMTTITATLDMLMGTATLTVSSAVITSITVGPANTVLPRGASVQATATANWSDNTMTDVTTQVTWASSDVLAVTISNAPGSQGVATAVAPGNVTLSASLGTVVGSMALRAAQAAVVAITVLPSATTLAINTTQQFTATGAFSDGSVRLLGNQAAWSTSDPLVATVDSTGPMRGLASGVAAGTATITATQDGVMGTATLAVSNTALVSVVVVPEMVELPVGFRVRLRANGNFDDGSTQDVTGLCVWSSSDGRIATVSNNASNTTRGRVNGLTVGVAVITATLGAFNDTSVVTVSDATLTSLTVEPETLMVVVDGFANLTATGTFSSNLVMDLTEQVTWTTADPLIAVVDNGRSRQGRVRGIGVGTSSITATAAGQTDSAAVTVQ